MYLPFTVLILTRAGRDLATNSKHSPQPGTNFPYLVWAEEKLLMFAQTEASLRTRRDGGGLKESSSELVLRDYPVFMQMMWDGRVTKGLIWSFTFCLASAASVPTSDSSVLAPVSIFHNGCFVPNKTKELLSKGSSFVLLSSHKYLRWGFIEFLSSSWRFKERLYNRSSQAENTLAHGFCSLKHHWIYSVKPLA